MIPQFGERLRAMGQPFWGWIDERIYAVVRMGFALVGLINLVGLWSIREILFAETGMIDQTAAIQASSWIYFSLFEIFRSPEAVSGYLIFNAVCLVLLLLGVFPRAAAAAVFVWHLSYQARGILGLGGWDNVLSSFSFLVLISPLGRSWSLGGHRHRTSGLAASYGLTLMRLQVLVIYWQTVVLKLNHQDSYWRDGEFMSYYLLSIFSRWPGPWVLDWSWLLALATWLALLIEIAVPVLLFIRQTRYYGALLGILLHLWICVLTPDLEMFFLAMAMSYLAFLRSEDVERLQRFWDRWLKKGSASSGGMARGGG